MTVLRAGRALPPTRARTAAGAGEHRVRLAASAWVPEPQPSVSPGTTPAGSVTSPLVTTALGVRVMWVQILGDFGTSLLTSLSLFLSPKQE